LGEIQKTIEGVVLGMENGSMGQRVCAEFLREMVTRVEAARQGEGRLERSDSMLPSRNIQLVATLLALAHIIHPHT